MSSAVGSSLLVVALSESGVVGSIGCHSRLELVGVDFNGLVHTIDANF
jgi:hypothetical protein